MAEMSDDERRKQVSRGFLEATGMSKKDVEKSLEEKEKPVDPGYLLKEAKKQSKR
jgi:hypothetical protein